MSVATSLPNEPQGKPVAVPECGLVAKWPVAGLSTSSRNGACLRMRPLGTAQVQELLTWRLLSRRTRSPEACSLLPPCACFVSWRPLLEDVHVRLGVDTARGRDGQHGQARKGPGTFVLSVRGHPFASTGVAVASPAVL